MLKLPKNAAMRDPLSFHRDVVIPGTWTVRPLGPRMLTPFEQAWCFERYEHLSFRPDRMTGDLTGVPHLRHNQTLVARLAVSNRALDSVIIATCGHQDFTKRTNGVDG